MGQHVDVVPHREQRADPAVALQRLHHAGRVHPGEHVAQQRAGVGCALTRLVHDSVAGDGSGAEQSTRDSDRVVPRRQRHHHTARFRHHQVGGGEVPQQAPSPVHRPELGVLVQRPRPGEYTLPCFVPRAARLGFVERRQFIGVRAQPFGGCVQQHAALRRRGPGPARLRPVRVRERGVDLILAGHRDRPDPVATGRVADLDHIRLYVRCGRRHALGTSSVVSLARLPEAADRHTGRLTGTSAGSRIP